VSNRTRYIRDHEDRLDTDDALHSEIIGSPTCICVHLRFGGTFANTGPSEHAATTCANRRRGRRA
jgi:hypothetical protein